MTNFEKNILLAETDLFIASGEIIHDAQIECEDFTLNFSAHGNYTTEITSADYENPAEENIVGEIEVFDLFIINDFAEICATPKETLYLQTILNEQL